MKPRLDYVTVGAMLVTVAATMFLWMRLPTVRIALRIAWRAFLWMVLGVIAMNSVIALARVALSLRAYWASGT